MIPNHSSDELDQRKLVPIIYQLMSQVAFDKLDKPNPFDQREQKSAQVIKHSVDYILSVNELLLEAASNQSDGIFSNQDILVICSYLNTLRGIIFNSTLTYYQKIKNLLGSMGRLMSQTKSFNVKLLSIVSTFQKTIVSHCNELKIVLQDEISQERKQPIFNYENRRPTFSPSTYFGNKNFYKIA